jgi:ABC-type lipoprotein export system ATPase subunit
MIKIERVSKVYKSKNKEKCVAIKDISLTLEDEGFVFIIGKSGSGKTTLLGLIGGLDNITKGDIVINGNSINSLKYKDLISYRNQMIGYIFQDFHLIDELTVEENIALALDLQNLKYTTEVAEALKNVDLEGYEKRYPKELSGGEKQRVAIARALVKNPKIILADEPTGNLDTKTTTQILNLLKRLSKERLVLMVSHNLSDATNYADRIIELSGGKIINDYIRNENYCYDYQIKDNKLILPLNKKINENEINEINQELSLGNIKSISQTEDVFIPNEKAYNEEENNIHLKSNRYNVKKLLKFTSTFIKKDFVKLFFYSFVVAMLIIMLGLAQLIVNFNQSEIIQKELASINQNTLSIKKNMPSYENVLVVDDSRFIDITDEDINGFYEEGYKGDIYRLINVTLDFGLASQVGQIHKPATFNPATKYYNGTQGVLITKEEYVRNKFGDIEYLCLAESIEDYGIYITDYTADAILAYTGNIFKDYESMMGYHKSQGVSHYAYVNGIIKTGYKDKHEYVTNKLDDITMSKDELQNLYNSEEYLSFCDDVIQNYSISYSFNSNFENDYLNSMSRTWTPCGNSTLTYNGISFPLVSNAWFQLYSYENKVNLKDNEVILNIEIYNSVFGTNYNVTNMNLFQPHTATYKYYHFYDEMRTNIVGEFEVKIVGLYNGRSYASEDIFFKLLDLNTFTTSLYFENISAAEIIFNTATLNNFEPNSVIAYSLSTMTKAVDVFSDFFVIIFVGLCVCSVIVLFSYGIKLVRERRYVIGILKALGIKDGDLTFVFGCQIFLLLAFIIIMYFLGSIMFIDLSNEILVKSLLELASNHFLLDIDVLYLKLPFMIQNSLLVLLIVIISFVVPLIKLKLLKPTNIIKAKE